MSLALRPQVVSETNLSSSSTLQIFHGDRKPLVMVEFTRQSVCPVRYFPLTADVPGGGGEGVGGWGVKHESLATYPDGR